MQQQSKSGAQPESVIPQRTRCPSKPLSIPAVSAHPEGATAPKQLKSMFESDTYYHPRLDLWPKVLLRWATALTEYPQSWTCLNIRHVDSLRLGNPLFLLRHHSYTVGSGLCITPIQTLAETPYCLNKWVRLAFICQENWGGAARLRSLVHVHVGVPPSSERGEVLKHVKIVHVSTQTWTMRTLFSYTTALCAAQTCFISCVSVDFCWAVLSFQHANAARRADFCSSGRWMILTEKTRLTPWSWINIESMRIGYVWVAQEAFSVFYETCLLGPPVRILRTESESSCAYLRFSQCVSESSQHTNRE